MAEISAIEWTDSTFNPWIGCTKVSPACDHCYAETLMDTRHGRVKWGGERSRTSAGNWQLPRRWQRQAATFQAEHGRRRRVFCASLADVFDNQVPADWRADLWDLIRDCPDLDWLLLTKRPQNIAKMLPDFWDEIRGRVWLGTSIENQIEVRRRLPALLSINPRPAVFFASAEPLLEGIEVSWFRKNDGGEIYPLNGTRNLKGDGSSSLTYWPLDWIIAGGESGPGARPTSIRWIRNLRDECDQAGTAFLFKQWGEWAPGLVFEGTIPSGQSHDFGDPALGDDLSSWKVGKKAAGRLLDGVTHDGFPQPGMMEEILR